MTEICVVHLVRACYGLDPFKQFLEAYAKHPGGIDHDLVLVFKGFRKHNLPTEFLRAAGDLRYRSLFTTDWGFDLRSYKLAAETFDHPYFCFLNSFSKPLDEQWLAKLNTSIRRPGAGLAGCTGSWESMYSNLFAADHVGQKLSFVARLWRPARVQLCKWFFEPFPNWHVRTNAFIISRELVQRFWPQRVITKRSAYLFENGKKNLTRQVLQMGKLAVVVGKDGRAYCKEEWPESKTYRSGTQENLLVADTQTLRFERADWAEKCFLARVAWGDRACVPLQRAQQHGLSMQMKTG